MLSCPAFREIRIEDAMRKAKDKLSCDERVLAEVKGALKRPHRLQEVTEFVKSTNWQQRCTLLFELIDKYFDDRKTAQGLTRHAAIDYVAFEVTQDFKEVFQAILKKYPRMHLNSTVHGYLIHVQNLIKKEMGFKYPDDILYVARTIIIGKFESLRD